MPPYPDSEFLSVPLDVGVSGIGNDSAVAAVVYWPDHAKVVDCIAAFVVVYVVNLAFRILAKHVKPCESVSGVLAALDLDLDVPVLARDGSGAVAYGYAHRWLNFPVKPSGYNAVIQKVKDIFGDLFHASILPRCG
jgi:hypothetical protein